MCSSQLYLDKVQIMALTSLKFLSFFFGLTDFTLLFYISKTKALLSYIMLIYVEISENILWGAFNLSGFI